MGRVNDKGQNDRAENADRGAVGGEGDDGDDDTCLCHGLSFDFEDKFHVKSQSQDGRKKEKKGLEEECWIQRSRERKATGTMPTAL